MSLRGPMLEITDNLPLTVDPDAQPPFGKFGSLYRKVPLFARLWRREITPKGSQSGYNLCLATLAAAEDWTDSEIVGLLIAHRRAGGGRPKLRPDYYARTLAHARAAARDITAPMAQRREEHGAFQALRDTLAPRPMRGKAQRA
jgi:hypothetical protein